MGRGARFTFTAFMAISAMALVSRLSSVYQTLSDPPANFNCVSLYVSVAAASFISPDPGAARLSSTAASPVSR